MKAPTIPNVKLCFNFLQDKSLKSLRDIVKFEVSDDQVVGPQYGVAKLFLKQQVLLLLSHRMELLNYS